MGTPYGAYPWQPTPPSGPLPVTTVAPELDFDPAKVRLLGLGVVGLIAAYLVIAALVYCMDIQCLKPYCLCFPDICEGRGCIGYKILCCPFVLVYNAFRLFVSRCCGVYLNWLRFTACCEGCCWEKFKDPEFPPTLNSIGILKGDTASGVIYVGAVEWKRASEICKAAGGEAQLYEGDIEAEDLHQGQIGDCWLIAALACIAQRPEILQRAICTKVVDPRGKYKFRLWNQIRQQAGTQWVDIVVDDYIPVFPGTLKPKFARANGNEMWAMLLEKAFAKMYGNYSRLEGGVMSWALSALTGNPAIHLDRKSGNTWRAAQGGYYTDQQFSDEELFNFLRRARRNGAFICCAGIAQMNRFGLIDGHAYSVLQLKTVRKAAASTDYFQMVEIRNPHGGGEWIGNWSDRSPLWNQFPRVRDKLMAGRQGSDDGSFWMQWQDFVKFWREVQLVDCETNIHTVPTPVYNENFCCGPLWACLRGCFYYWFCCVGLKRLFFGRSGAHDIQVMKSDMDRKCGYDQDGFYCTLCEQRAVESSSSSDSGYSSG